MNGPLSTTPVLVGSVLVVVVHTGRPDSGVAGVGPLFQPLRDDLVGRKDVRSVDERRPILGDERRGGVIDGDRYYTMWGFSISGLSRLLKRSWCEGGNGWEMMGNVSKRQHSHLGLKELKVAMLNPRNRGIHGLLFMELDGLKMFEGSTDLEMRCSRRKNHVFGRPSSLAKRGQRRSTDGVQSSRR